MEKKLSPKVARVKREDCVACGTCVKACPMGAASVFRGSWARIDEGICVGCGKCAGACPTGCVSVIKRGEAQ